MRATGKIIYVNCKRCGKRIFKWQRSKQDEEAHPFFLDSICGRCIDPEEVARHYPLSRGIYLKSKSRH